MQLVFVYSPRTKLMRFNRPQANIRFKSALNRLLIDFFDPIPAVRFNHRDDLIQIQTHRIRIISKICRI